MTRTAITPSTLVTAAAAAAAGPLLVDAHRQLQADDGGCNFKRKSQTDEVFTEGEGNLRKAGKASHH